MVVLLALALCISASAHESRVDAAEKKEPTIVKEILSKRTQYSKHYLMSDGSYQAVITGYSQHYENEGGEWKDIDVSLTDKQSHDQQLISKEFQKGLLLDGQDSTNERTRAGLQNQNQTFFPVQVPYYTQIHKLFDSGYTVGKERERLTIIPMNSNPVLGIQEDNTTILYQGAWEKADVRLQVQTDGIKETIILHDSEAPNQFSFELIGIDSDSSLEALQLEAPWLEDALGQRRNVFQEKRVEGDRIFLDYHIQTEDLVYPIVIDPSISTSGMSFGSVYYSEQYGSRITDWNDCSYPYFFCSTFNVGFTYNESDSSRESAALKYDLLSIPSGSLIASAELKLHYTNNTTLFNIRVTRLLSFGNLNYLDTIENKASTTIPVAQNQWLAIDITNIFKDQMIYGNKGIFLASEGDGTMNIKGPAYSDPSLRPQLVVTYNASPNQPYGLNPGSTNASSPSLFTTKTPALNWVFSDPDSSVQSQFHIQIFNMSDTLVHDSSWVNSSTTSYTVPAHVLQSGTSYYWKVRTKDPYNFESPFSIPLYFRVNLLPQLTSLSFVDGQQIDDNSLHFSWGYSDADNQPQTQYQLVGSQDNWATWAYNSGEVNSAAASHAITLHTFGEWDFAVRVRDGYDWSDWYFRNNLYVNPLPDRSATMISNTIPATMEAGETYPVSVMVKNTGNMTWDESQQFRLGAIEDRDPFADTRQAIAPGQSVPTNQSYTFTFNMTAPTGPAAVSSRVTDWRMVQDGITWFGESLTKTVNIVDTLPPKVTSTEAPAEVIVGSNGTYDIYVYEAADSGSGVKNVRFPTWTEANGQDDIVWYEGTNMGDGTWKVTIPIPQHNMEAGTYITHIYVYDWAGNSAMVAQNLTLVKLNKAAHFYTPDGKIDRIELPTGEVYRYQYDSKGNLLRITKQ